MSKGHCGPLSLHRILIGRDSLGRRADHTGLRRVGPYGTNSGSASVITLVSSATPLRRYLGTENIPRCVTPS